MSDFENLKARRSAIYAELAALTTGKAGGNANQKDVGIDHVGYKKGLYDELREINGILQDGGGLGADSPNVFEIVSEGWT